MALVVAAGAFLGGCALPPVMTVASFALDFASYGETGKSVSDHGLSFLLQKDCALLRIFQGELCRDEIDPNAPETALAALEPMGDPAARVVAEDPMELPSDLAYLDGPGGRALTRGPGPAPERSTGALGIVLSQAFTGPDGNGASALDWAPAGGPDGGASPRLGDYLGDGARTAADDGGALGVYLSNGWLPGNRAPRRLMTDYSRKSARG